MNRRLRPHRRLAVLTLALALAAQACDLGVFSPPASDHLQPLDSARAPAFLVVEAGGARATFFDRDGGVLGSFGDLPWDPPLTGRAAPVGPAGVPPAATALAFFERASEGAFLRVGRADASERLASLDRPVALTASAHAPYVVYAETRAARAGPGEVQRLVLVDLSEPDAPQLQVLLEQAAPAAGAALRPLAIRLEAGRPAEVFYCQVENDRAPCRGLRSIEIVGGEVSVRIGPEAVVLGISLEAGLAALVQAGEATPQVELRALDSGGRVIFAPHAGVLRVGAACFSPEGTRLAWGAAVHDGSGELAAEVVLARAEGGVTVRVTGERVGEAVGGVVEELRPAGWLDEQDLLLQAVVDGQALVLRVRSDGSALRRVTAGEVLGFVWP